MNLISGPVIVPHPVIIPTGGGGSGPDIPTPWAIAYGVVAVLVWMVASFFLSLKFAHDMLSPVVDGESIAFGVLVGACVAVVWPASLACGLLWLGIRRVLREH